ncbi:MAG TPA: hypothetical protein VFJ27_05090, partial [Terriglobia bacterium]|nr:hypothetical protein [Terriglobia bacterium]
MAAVMFSSLLRPAEPHRANHSWHSTLWLKRFDAGYIVTPTRGRTRLLVETKVLIGLERPVNPKGSPIIVRYVPIQEEKGSFRKTRPNWRESPSSNGSDGSEPGNGIS